MSNRLRTPRQGTPLGDETLQSPLPMRDSAHVGEAIVGDTRQGDLCRVQLWIAGGRIVDAEFTLLAEESQQRAAVAYLSFLKGRAYAEVLDAATARSCSSDGCSSVEGKCFSLLQEAVFRALGDYARQYGPPDESHVVSTPAGGVDLSHRVTPEPVEERENYAALAEWARERMLPPE